MSCPRVLLPDDDDVEDEDPEEDSEEIEEDDGDDEHEEVWQVLLTWQGGSPYTGRAFKVFAGVRHDRPAYRGLIRSAL